jgi:peptide/nickel transport system substrate-binding protein
MLASAHIHEMVYDSATGYGMNNRSFDYQAINWTKVPSLADGDALLNAVTASEGDTVVDAAGNVALLDPAADPPVSLRPAGGTDDDIFVYEGGDVELDQMEVSFTLVPGLTWSDGTPVTAADSVYSFSVAADPDSSSAKYTIERTASYEAADDVTVVWTGLPGYKDSEYYTNGWMPLPEHQLGQYTASELLEAEESSRIPMGFGPYIIQDWVAGDSITLVKNPTYFRADEGLPVFETVIVRFVGENSNANIAAILSGECDIVDQTSGLDDQSELLLELQSAGQINPTFVTGTVWEHIDFGIQPISYDATGAATADRPDFFSDVRMRQAFIQCMDRQAVVDTVLFGQSQVIDVYIPPQHPLFNEDAVSYPYDPEAAGALLDEVGWLDDDGDPVTPRVASGVEGVPDGTLLEMAYETTTATLRQQVTAVIQQSLAQCGIQANINLMPAGEWFADGPEGPLFGRRFDLGEFAWLTGVAPPCNLYLSTETPGPGGESMISIQTGEEVIFQSAWGGQNDPGFVNAEYDAACNAALQSLPGQPEYEAAHKEAQLVFSEQLPVAPLFLRLKLAATRPDFCNFIMDPTENSEMWNIEEFDYGACAE